MNDISDYMLEMAKHQGIVCTTVKDGHVLIFNKQTLLSLLDRCEESEKKQVVVFVKRNDMSA